MLKSTNGGASWTKMPLPFAVVTSGIKINWIPTLLPLSNTSMFLIASSDVPGDGIVSERFGTGAITTP